ncbi:flagellar biosynthesis repressor FlbT [Zavarzinia sp. CC-PAN008]|uniref:flagellar biosynthesis repressor FlbT n=1 Tax=Zavarzinia sp. CC-PAN008 TaxID=3243332 RepID=UPI003F743809
MALKINLKPGEKLVINGAVIENGDHRASLLILNKASILRQRDIMQPDEVTTPARRIYFAIMMMYLDADGHAEHYAEFALRSSEFISAISSSEGLDLCLKIGRHVLETNYYQALMTCRKLLEFEAKRLAAAAQPATIADASGA